MGPRREKKATKLISPTSRQVSPFQMYVEYSQYSTHLSTPTVFVRTQIPVISSARNEICTWLGQTPRTLARGAGEECVKSLKKTFCCLTKLHIIRGRRGRHAGWKVSCYTQWIEPLAAQFDLRPIPLAGESSQKYLSIRKALKQYGAYIHMHSGLIDGQCIAHIGHTSEHSSTYMAS